MGKPFQVKKTIGGKEYTAQFNGIGAALDGQDFWNAEDGAHRNRRMADYILKNVIVDPAGLTPDSFNIYGDMNDVVSWGLGVMNGYFRTEAAAESDGDATAANTGAKKQS